MCKIDRIIVEGFKSFEHMEISLTEVNLLIGINGAGKSNFLSIFKLIKNVRRRTLREYVAKSGGAKKFLYMGASVTQKLHIMILYKDNIKYHLTLGHADANQLVILDEYFQDLGSKKKVCITSPGQFESEYSKSAQFTTIKKDISKLLQEQNKLHIYHFSDVSPTSSLGIPSEIHDNRILKENGSNLSSVLYRLMKNKPKQFHRLQRIVNLAAPYFKEFDLRRDPLNNSMILLEWRHSQTDYVFGSSDLSDGTKRLIGILVAIYQNDPPMQIIIDEPELGLHPLATKLLAEVIAEMRVKNQFIMTTQSPIFLNSFDPEDVAVIEYKVDHSEIRRLEREKLDLWLENYSLGNIWQMNLIGGRP